MKTKVLIIFYLILTHSLIYWGSILSAKTLEPNSIVNIIMLIANFGIIMSLFQYSGFPFARATTPSKWWHLLCIFLFMQAWSYYILRLEIDLNLFKFDTIWYPSLFVLSVVLETIVFISVLPRCRFPAPLALQSKSQISDVIFLIIIIIYFFLQMLTFSPYFFTKIIITLPTVYIILSIRAGYLNHTHGMVNKKTWNLSKKSVFLFFCIAILIAIVINFAMKNYLYIGKDGIVRVETINNSRGMLELFISDLHFKNQQKIDTRASVFHKYSIIFLNAQNFLLKSSDIGSFLVQQDNFGSWSCRRVYEFPSPKSQYTAYFVQDSLSNSNNIPGNLLLYCRKSRTMIVLISTLSIPIDTPAKIIVWKSANSLEIKTFPSRIINF